MEIELRVVQFWSEIKLVITNNTPAARSCDFVITRLISDQIALHSVQLPLLSLADTSFKAAILYLSPLSPVQTSNFSLTSFICSCVRLKIDKFSLTRSLVEKLVMSAFQPGNLFVCTAVKEKLFVVHTRK